MPLAAGLARVLAEYETARAEPLTSHPLAVYVRDGLAAEVARLVPDDRSYKVKGSVGAGNWAETPWVSVFDVLVTESATRGFYFAFLFRADRAGVYLSLNQGATEVRERWGPQYKEVLSHQASAYRSLLLDQRIEDLLSGPIELRGEGWLTRGYAAGNIVSVYYAVDAIPSDDHIANDVMRFLALYRVLVEARDLVAEDADPAATEGIGGGDVAPGVEAAKERWHRRVERSPRLARAAKRYHGNACKVCGFTFETKYGEIGRDYIEAHHLLPFADLRGRPTQLDPRTDFTVVCANCHRMLHRERPPLTLEDLIGRLNG